VFLSKCLVQGREKQLSRILYSSKSQGTTKPAKSPFIKCGGDGAAEVDREIEKRPKRGEGKFKGSPGMGREIFLGSAP